MVHSCLDLQREFTNSKTDYVQSLVESRLFSANKNAENINRTDNVRITKQRGAITNHCCRGTARSSTFVFACALARVGVCVRVGAWARVRMHARARVALLIQHATRMRHIVSSFVVFLESPNFLTLSHKRHNFREESY